MELLWIAEEEEEEQSAEEAALVLRTPQASKDRLLSAFETHLKELRIHPRGESRNAAKVRRIARCQIKTWRALLLSVCWKENIVRVQQEYGATWGGP